MSFIQVSGIIKSFGNLKVLKDVSFSVEKGEVVSIIGSSGSGKTTLLRCLNFLEVSESGSFILDGKTMFDFRKKLTDIERQKNQLYVGLVFQSFNLFPHYSILKNVTLAPLLLIKQGLKDYSKKTKSINKTVFESLNQYYGREEIIDKRNYKAKIRLKAYELLTKVGLDSKINSYPHELSGGQLQRVAIARALALNPSFLCFDEPTSALDPQLTNEVLNTIFDLKRDGRTMLIVTHEMDFARRVSDKIIFMKDGCIEEEGKPNEIFDNPKSQNLKAFLSTASFKKGH